MYARVSRYRMKPERFEEAQALVEQIKPQIQALPGLRDWKNVGRADDGTGVVIALYDDEAAANAATAAAQEIWGRFADHLAGPPQVEGYDIVTGLPD